MIKKTCKQKLSFYHWFPTITYNYLSHFVKTFFQACTLSNHFFFYNSMLFLNKKIVKYWGAQSRAFVMPLKLRWYPTFIGCECHETCSSRKSMGLPWVVKSDFFCLQTSIVFFLPLQNHLLNFATMGQRFYSNTILKGVGFMAKNINYLV